MEQRVGIGGKRSELREGKALITRRYFSTHSDLRRIERQNLRAIDSRAQGNVVRLLTSQDAEAFRALRLEALELNPESFGAHLEEEKFLPAAEFGRRIDPTDKALAFGEFDDAGALAGFMGWFRERGIKSSHKSWLWGSYVRPHLRGRGIGAALLRAVLGQVRDVGGVSQVQLHVGAQNAPAQSLYLKFGFIRVASLPESLIVEGRAIDEELWVLRINEKVES